MSRHPEAPRHWFLMLLWALALALGWTVGPFLAAGTWRWPRFWAYAAALIIGTLAHRRYVASKNPELLKRRQRIGEGTQRWDLVWNFLYWPQMIAAPIVAGLGVRYGWAQAPWPLFLLGLVLYAAGMSVSGRAMAVNPHFEGTVRLQEELGHRVIDVGPYSVIRHPGYLGLALWGLAQPLLLGSWAAGVPAVMVVLWIALRTALEDAFLRRALPGYGDYAGRVRARLLPGVW